MQTYRNSHNPILPLAHHIPDGEAHVFSDGRLYIYGSYDELEGAWCSTRYRVASTADMQTWTVHDIAFDGAQVPWYFDPGAPNYNGPEFQHRSPFMERRARTAPAEDLARTPRLAAELPCLYAPDCAEKDGKYYLYFCMSDGSEGVAVSNRPEGPFHDPVHLPCSGIDPAVFRDRDGQAYYYWGQFYPMGVRLAPDMVSFDPKGIVFDLASEEAHFFHEGSSLRRIGDTYYFVFSCMQRGRPTALGYATSKAPLGPFTYRGILIDNLGCDPATWNNHGSIECVNGQWYVFYHRSSRNTQLFRRLCIEPITINADGSIDEVRMTSQGPGAPFGPGEKLMGWQACSLTGRAYIDADPVHEESLQHIAPGDAAVFRYVRSARPYARVSLECEGQGRVRILLDGVCAGTVAVDGNAKVCTAPLQAAAGEYELTLAFDEADALKLISVTLE